MSARTKVRVRILNEEYAIGGGRPEEQLQAAAAYVNEVLAELSASIADVSPSRLAVLAAINIASELLELRARTERLEAAVTGGAAQMLALLEARTSAPQAP
jgi:cell division protein ZapA